MIVLVRTMALLGATLMSSSCVWWFFEPKTENKAEIKKKARLMAVPPHPMTWPEFVTANQGRGLTIPQLERRFNSADENGDGLLTPQEISHHRVQAAARKSQQTGN